MYQHAKYNAVLWWVRFGLRSAERAIEVVRVRLHAVPALQGHLLALYALICISGAMLIPPLQSPDEPAHLGRAYLLAHGQLLLDSVDKIGTGGRVDTGFIAYVEKYAPVSSDIQLKITPTLTADASSIRWSGQREFRPAPGTAYYFPLIYLPQAIGLALGENLGCTIADSILLARIAVVLSGMMLLLLAAAIMPIPPLVLTLLCLPMSLFQASCSGIDGVANAATVLTLAAYWRSRTSTKSQGSLAILIAAAALVASSRQHLFVLLPLALLRAVHHGSRFAQIACALLILLVIAWNIHAGLHTIDLRVLQAPSLLLKLQQPGKFFVALTATLTHLPTLLLLATSFVGVLGWLNLHLPKFLYLLFAGYIAAHAVATVKQSPWRHQLADRCWLLLSALGSVLIIFFALWATWTPQDIPIISGLQGRYFLGPALLIAYSASHLNDSSTTVPERPGAAVATATFLIVSAITSAAVLAARYYGNGS